MNLMDLPHQDHHDEPRLMDRSAQMWAAVAMNAMCMFLSACACACAIPSVLREVSNEMSGH
jgi:hypothetical protein